MQLSSQLIALWATLLPQVAANFDIYRVEWAGPFKTAVSWQIFDAQPSCDQAIHTPVWTDSSNVSGNSMGVRCKGSGCGQTPPPENIDELEIHVSNNPLYHWTIYKNRNRALIGLDGNSYGDCIVFPQGDYDCNGQIPYIHGRRKFRCLSRFTAAQLNSAA